MALTIAYQPPIVQLPAGNAGSGPTYGGPAGSHINQYDFCKLITGNLVPVVPGDTTNIVGVATADSNAVFYDTEASGSGNAQSVFGISQIGATAGLMPFSPSYLLVNTVYGLLVEMTLSQSYTWTNPGQPSSATTATIGTRVGINVVGGTGGIGAFNNNSNFYYADPAQSACGTIEALVTKPAPIGNPISYQGAAGVRVLVSIDTTACLNIGR